MQIFGVVAFIRASNGQTIVLIIYSAYKLTIKKRFICRVVQVWSRRIASRLFTSLLIHDSK